jgi:hypothetical protein
MIGRFIQPPPRDQHCFLEKVFGSSLITHCSTQVRHEHGLVLSNENLEDRLGLVVLASEHDTVPFNYYCPVLLTTGQKKMDFPNFVSG